MSFADEIDVQTITEGVIKKFFSELKGIDVATPFPRMTYKEAMESYGSDKPDLRFELKFSNFSDIVAGSGFKVFAENVAKGGVVAGFNVPGGASYTRNQMDNLVDFTKTLGAGGLAYIKVTEKGAESAIEKFLGKELLTKICERAGAKMGDLVSLFPMSGRKHIQFSGRSGLRWRNG